MSRRPVICQAGGKVNVDLLLAHHVVYLDTTLTNPIPLLDPFKPANSLSSHFLYTT